ncbi:MAG TPA: RodZ domain-containing protein, partial [Alphaproteobacteria bacterium]|nr:RodZ domain-containing protein [Alphaproteobacteria bacterium]
SLELAKSQAAGASAAPAPVAVPAPPPAPVAAAPAPAPVAKPARRPRVGETLREAREGAGFTLAEVADEVKIKLSYLQAIEDGRYGDLPSRTYAVGFVRTYAQALGLQSEELVARCRSEVGGMPKLAAPLVMPEPEVDRRLPGGTLMTICAILAVAVYAASYAFLRPASTSEAYSALPPAVESQAEASAAPAQTPAPVAAQSTPPVAATPVPDKAAEEKAAAEKAAQEEKAKAEEALKARQAAEAEEKAKEEAQAAEEKPVAPPPVKAVKAPSRIKLHAVSDTTVRIQDSQGHVLAERMIHRGEAFFVPDNHHYTLATTNAGALRLQVDGRSLPPLGALGEPMHNIPLDAGNLLKVVGE